jgi:hypothetical protein
MRLILSAIVLLFLSACSDKQPEKLEDAFIFSMQKNDFNVLKNFLPDRKFYDAISDKMPKRTDKEIQDFLNESNDRIKQAWQNSIFNVAQKKIDLNKVMIRDVFYYDPFPNDKTSEAMIVNYEYKGKVWDDIQFIVARKTGKTVLLEIPNPTRAFSMSDPELRATGEAKTWIEMSKPAFKETITELSEKLIKAARENRLDEFGQHLAYNGNDDAKRWRVPLNMNDSSERKQAAELMQRLNHNMENCEKYQTGNVVTQRESEGVWIVWPISCGNKIIRLAYLRINGKLLLGDTDANMN